MPYQSDGIVMQLRSSIMIAEQDLSGPLPPQSCSSLDDGPYCDRFLLNLPGSVGGGNRQRLDADFLSTDDMRNSAQFVVDGVLSQRIQARNKEAFDWNQELYRTFSSLVSRIAGESWASSKDTTRQLSSKVRQPVLSQSGSQCFRIAFNRLLPGWTIIPSNFSAGMPKGIGAKWEGVWEVAPMPKRPRTSGTGAEDGMAALAPLAWAVRLELHTALGYLRFTEPVVVRRLVIGVPAVAALVDGGQSSESWGYGGLICGRLKGSEKWCVPLHQVAAVARSTSAPLEEHSKEDMLWADVGNSIHSIDEVAIIGAPETGLALALVELAATPPWHPRHSSSPAQQRVVLLQRPVKSPAGATSRRVEPVLQMVSRDAAVWDLNDILRHNMRLGTPVARPGKPAAGGRRERGQTVQKLHSFQEMLRGLKAAKISPPPGVTFARLKKEVSDLVASTKEIQDGDVLIHSKIESLLQSRLREKGLDGLLALQAAWRRSMPPPSSDEQATAESGMASLESRAQRVEEEEQPHSGSAVKAAPKERRSGVVPVLNAGDSDEAVRSRDQWDAVVEEVEQVSTEFIRKTAAASERKQKGGLDLHAALSSGRRIEIDLGDDVASLQDLVEQVKEAVASAQAVGAGDKEGAARMADVDGMETLGENDDGNVDYEGMEASDLVKKVTQMFTNSGVLGQRGYFEDGVLHMDGADDEAITSESLRQALQERMAELWEQSNSEQNEEAADTADDEADDAMKSADGNRVHVKLLNMDNLQGSEQLAQVMHAVLAQHQQLQTAEVTNEVFRQAVEEAYMQAVRKVQEELIPDDPSDQTSGEREEEEEVVL